MTTKEIVIPEEMLLSKIYVIRGQKVMLDRDLAELFQVKPFRLREQVKRNLVKFPQHFMFKLDKQEVRLMVSQNAIPSHQSLGGQLPYVFTEYGILQLSNTLKSETAIKMSIRIIELFVKMREILMTHKDLLLELEEIRKKMASQDERLPDCVLQTGIDLVFDYLTQFITKDETELERRKIGFKPNS
ncbi:MAG: ORF6N domain-containing protein [Bacteroidetes bacterium]|nr:ORF6N domain-containing protein [Bacteroidota bacterium]